MLDFFKIFDVIALFLRDSGSFFEGSGWEGVVFWWKIVSVIISVILVVGIVYSAYNAFSILRKRKIGEFFDVWSDLPIEKRANRWASVKMRLESIHPADWNMAVLEADGILDDIMKKIGYRGATLGERLKNIEPSDFDSLQDVWEAHKVRNRIAHEAADFKLEKEEAERIIGLFEKGLKELEYIT